MSKIHSGRTRKFAALAVAAGVASLAVSASSGLAAEVAKVNGQSITDRDMELALSQLNAGMREAYLKDSTNRRQLISSLIEQELLVAEAQKQKVDQTQEFKEALDAFRRTFLANKILEKNLTPKLTDSAAKKFYESNKRRYSTDQVHAQHILVTEEAKAQELIKLAREPKADFQVLAEKNSKDPSAKNNRGDLGYFERGRMVPAFTEAAFAASPGDIVGPVKTDYGYHIIKVIEKKPGKTLGYEEVEASVRRDLQQEMTQDYVSGLKKQAKITISEKAVSGP